MRSQIGKDVLIEPPMQMVPVIGEVDLDPTRLEKLAEDLRMEFVGVDQCSVKVKQECGCHVHLS